MSKVCITWLGSMLKRGKKSITGKTIGPHGSQIKRIKPQSTRKIIRRYHFLLQRKQLLLRWLNFQDTSTLERDDNEIMEHATLKSPEFVKGWKIRGDSLKSRDLKIEEQLVKLPQSGKQNDPSQLCFYLGYIMKELKDESGINLYQEASRMGQDANRGGDSSKILIRWIKENEYDLADSTALEIGSLSRYNAISTCGIFNSVTRIDLNNCNNEDGIIQQDFMERPIPKTDNDRFDLISCSLVLNFVPTPIERGSMCLRFSEFLRKDRPSYLFIVLPLPCINNSRYMTLDYFTEMFASLGYKRIKYHGTKKICYFLFLFNEDNKPKESFKNYSRKHKLKDGPSMNNFSITLP